VAKTVKAKELPFMKLKVKTLIIEDVDRVAMAIERQLLQMKNFQVDHSRNVAQALDRLNVARNAPYDLILCDYNLGESTNGQQLLEFLRSEERIPRQTAFIMVTGDSSYDVVASAVELAPDAYLLKPFTHDALEKRIDYAMSKREALRAPHLRIDNKKPDLVAAIRLCNVMILSNNRFMLDALKLKAECLITLGRWGEAADVYDKIIAWRSTSWAEVGRARTLRQAGHPEIAERNLLLTIDNFPTFVAAYDELAALAEQREDNHSAQEFLEIAYSIVPSNRRTRSLGLMALQNNDLEKAVRLLKIVTERDRYGLKRSPEDFFMLSTALRRLNRYDEAMTVLDTLKEYFPETLPLQVRRMAAEAMILAAGNRPYDAKKRIREALKLRHEQMEPGAQLELGEACYESDEREMAQKLFLHVAENWQADPKVCALVKKTIHRAGLGAEELAMIEQSADDLMRTNQHAAKRIEDGEYEEVIDELEDLAKRLPNHADVQAHFVHALLLLLEQDAPQNLMDLPRDSKPWKNFKLVEEHLDILSAIKPEHFRLELLINLFAKLNGWFSANKIKNNTHKWGSMESGH
jgi:DNA-binding response OmpR family regulator